MGEIDLRKFEPDEQEYHLKCVITPYQVSYDDIQSQGSLGNMERTDIALIPSESSEMYRFMNAWLGLPGEEVNVIVRIDHPFHMYVRTALMWPKSQDKPEFSIHSLLEHHFLHLMNYGLAQIILAQPSLHGKEIEIVTMPASTDHPDGAPTDGNYVGEDLYSGTRRDVKVPGMQPIAPMAPGQQKLKPDSYPDRHGRVFPSLKDRS